MRRMMVIIMIVVGGSILSLSACGELQSLEIHETVAA